MLSNRVRLPQSCGPEPQATDLGKRGDLPTLLSMPTAHPLNSSGCLLTGNCGSGPQSHIQSPHSNQKGLPNHRATPSSGSR